MGTGWVQLTEKVSFDAAKLGEDAFGYFLKNALFEAGEEGIGSSVNFIAADFAGKIVDNLDLFRSLVRSDMTVAERFVESVKDFITKVKSTFSKDKSKMDTAALEKYGATVSELETAVKTYEEMIETTQAAVSSGQFNIENTAETEQGGGVEDSGIMFSKKRIETLTENDVRNLLESSVYGEFANRSYIPLRRNTPQVLIDAIKQHSNGSVEVADLPIAMNVEKAVQALEEEAFDEKNRSHGISVDGMIEIIKGMDDPAYIILQKNGRYVEVVRYYDGKSHSAWAVLDFSEFHHEQYLNGYPAGNYNILVTTFNPDDLADYMKTNVEEIVYDKKMKESLQSGSGSLFPSHLNSSPFYNSIPETSGKSNPQNSEKTSEVDAGRGESDAKKQYSMKKGAAVAEPEAEAKSGNVEIENTAGALAIAKNNEYNYNTNYALKKPYWKPDLSKYQLNKLMMKIKTDIRTSENSLTDKANWLFTDIEGMPVFAIYSTENVDNPTLLYESKGAKAEREKTYLINFMEELKNGENSDIKSSAFVAVSIGSWMQQGASNQNSVRGLGRGRSNSNAGVLPGQSKGKPSRAFINVLENLTTGERGRGRINNKVEEAVDAGDASTASSASSGKSKQYSMKKSVAVAEPKTEAKSGNVGIENTAGENMGGVRRYSLKSDARQNVEKAITQKGYNGEIELTTGSPPILTSQKGTKNYPLVMNASHIRENILTEKEARALGLKVNKNIHYHGLGKEKFLNIIEDLDNVTEAYRGTRNADKPERRENYFLLISKYTDEAGNVINVPIYIDEKAQVNNVFIDVNKVATVFGREELKVYIKEQIAKGNLVRIKNRSINASEGSSPFNDHYSKDASINSIPDLTEKSNPQNSEKKNTDNLGRELSDGQAEYFKDSKARDKDGNLLVMYHQTGEDFSVFETERKGAGSSDDQTPFGIFMKTSDKDIGLRGKKQMPLYANIINPLRVESRAELSKKLREISPEFKQIENDLIELNKSYKQKTDKAAEDIEKYLIEWRKRNPDAKRRDIYNDAVFNRLSEIEDATIEEWEIKEAEQSVSSDTSLPTNSIPDSSEKATPNFRKRQVRVIQGVKR